MGFVSGQFPIRDGELRYRGRVGDALDLEAGRDATRLCALNALAQIETHLGGWSRFGGLLRVEGFVASTPDFFRQPEVLDGASTLFVEALGTELGAHARTAFAVERLPLDSSIELCVTFFVKEPGD
jgi:enamine deaminase RidA (YjgF/YER057c/UK114 family)